MSAGSFILDSELRGILNTNELGGNVVYNNSNYDYITEELLYDGIPVWISSALSELGALSASAVSSVSIQAIASSNFQSLSAAASSDVANLVSASSELGQLISSSTAITQIQALAESEFGEIGAFAVPTVSRFADASSDLGFLSASANSGVDNSSTASADLGSLSASATATSPTPPTPPTPSIGGGGGRYRQVKRVVKPKPQPPTGQVIEELFSLEELPKLVKTHFSKADTISFNFTSSAQSQIDFSILEDEAELLLLI